MTPDLPPNPRAELEAKVTAWLLGELSAEEAAQVREQIAKDPELGRLQERLSQTLNLLRETVATPMGETPAQPAPLKLSPERREKLLAHFKTVKPKEFAQPPRRKTSLVFVLAAAASVAILAALLMPSLSGGKFQAHRKIDLSRLVAVDQSAPTADTLPPVMTGKVNGFPSELPSAAPVASAEIVQRLQERRLSENATNAVILPQRAEQQLVQENNQQNVTQLNDVDQLGNNRSLGVQTEQNGDNKSQFQANTGSSVVAAPASGAIAGVNSYGNAPGNISLNGWQGNPPADSTSHVLQAHPSTPPSSGGGATVTFNTASGVANPAPSTPNVTSGVLAWGPDSKSGSRSAVDSFETGKEKLAKVEPEQLREQPAPVVSPALVALPEDATGKLTASADETTPTAPHAGEQMRRMKSVPSYRKPISITPIPESAPSSATTSAPPAAAFEFATLYGSTAAPITYTNATDLTLLQSNAAAATPSTNGVLTYAFQDSLKEKLSADKSKDGLANADREEASKQLESKKVEQTDAPLSHPMLLAPVPQPEVLTRSNAFTTFSLNISDVAFKLAQASLQNGVMPEAASMRSEEFINAFDYRDPEPAPGAAIGFVWERAADPFAHNRDFLRFAIKTAAQGRQAGRPINLVLLLDKSGSMERADRVAIIANALRVLASQLQPQDTLSVVVFARTARLFVDGVPGSQAGDVAKKLRDLTPEGGTNLEEAMRLAYETAFRHYLANGENRVVLLTDGAANLGNVEPDALKQKVETNRKQGIAFDCFGVGWDGYNDDLLEKLSRAGNGRYGFINTPEEAATEFAGKLAGALRVAAADVKVQVEFNPARVTSYRQIGYAKDQLKKEDFRDNNVKAAQIGAAESGNALYTVEVNPAGEGPLCTVHVRFRRPGTPVYEEHEWIVPYGGSAVPLEKASPAMRLTATAAAFSEWLAGSPFAGEVTPDRLLGYLNGVPQVYGADTRPEKLVWMIRQAKSISGK